MSLENVKEVGPFDATCPYCGASSGAPCVGVKPPDLHQGRFWAAAKQTMDRYTKAVLSIGERST